MQLIYSYYYYKAILLLVLFSIPGIKITINILQQYCKVSIISPIIADATTTTSRLNKAIDKIT